MNPKCDRRIGTLKKGLIKYLQCSCNAVQFIETSWPEPSIYRAYCQKHGEEVVNYSFMKEISEEEYVVGIIMTR
jgi:hypothetical protein